MIETVSETGSTNADILERLRNGNRLNEGDWLRAERQTRGRGRLGREWQSPTGNLHCSTLVILRPSDHSAATLSMVAGLAVYDCVRRCLSDHTVMLLKWPNDLLIRGEKIAGILLERQDDCVVVGIGINVSHAPAISGRKTTDIVCENNKFESGPGEVLNMLAGHFAKRLAEWRDQSLSHTALEWAIRSHRFNDRLRVTGSEGKVLQGYYRGITPDCGLRIQPIDSQEQVIHAGDVSLLWDDDEEMA